MTKSLLYTSWYTIISNAVNNQLKFSTWNCLSNWSKCLRAVDCLFFFSIVAVVVIVVSWFILLYLFVRKYHHLNDAMPFEANFHTDDLICSVHGGTTQSKRFRFFFFFMYFPMKKKECEVKLANANWFKFWYENTHTKRHIKSAIHGSVICFCTIAFWALYKIYATLWFVCICWAHSILTPMPCVCVYVYSHCFLISYFENRAHAPLSR